MGATVKQWLELAIRTLEVMGSTLCRGKELKLYMDKHNECLSHLQRHDRLVCRVLDV